MTNATALAGAALATAGSPLESKVGHSVGAEQNTPGESCVLGAGAMIEGQALVPARKWINHIEPTGLKYVGELLGSNGIYAVEVRCFSLPINSFVVAI